MTPKIKKHQIYITMGALLSVLLFIVIAPSQNARSEEPQVLGEEIEVPVKFPSVNLGGKAGAVYDPMGNGVIFSYNAEAQLPLASVTKVMTSIVALENIPENYVIKISEQALEAEGESGLSLGDEWQRDDLIKYMLMVSSNDAAEALSITGSQVTGKDFIELMNEKARELGLSQTMFYSPSGLDRSFSLPGAYGSATDVAKMILYAWQNYPDIWEITTKSVANFSTLDGKLLKAENTNQSSIRTTLIRASKTGLTPLAGGNLAVVFEAGPSRPIAVVTLGSTELGRFNDIETLINATLAYLTI